jgi:hypothetical protein
MLTGIFRRKNIVKNSWMRRRIRSRSERRERKGKRRKRSRGNLREGKEG